MPISADEARRVVEARLRAEEAVMNAELSSSSSARAKALHLIVTKEEERATGWLYFYDSREHAVDGDVIYALAGNWPFFVSRDDGTIDHVNANMRDELLERWKKQKRSLTSGHSPTPL